MADLSLLSETLRAWEQGRVIVLRNLNEEKTPDDPKSIRNQAEIISRSWLERKRTGLGDRIPSLSAAEIRKGLQIVLVQMEELYQLSQRLSTRETPDNALQPPTEAAGHEQLLELTRRTLTSLWRFAEQLDRHLDSSP